MIFSTYARNIWVRHFRTESFFIFYFAHKNFLIISVHLIDLSYLQFNETPWKKCYCTVRYSWRQHNDDSTVHGTVAILKKKKITHAVHNDDSTVHGTVAILKKKKITHAVHNDDSTVHGTVAILKKNKITHAVPVPRPISSYNLPYCIH